MSPEHNSFPHRQVFQVEMCPLVLAWFPSEMMLRQRFKYRLQESTREVIRDRKATDKASHRRE